MKYKLPGDLIKTESDSLGKIWEALLIQRIDKAKNWGFRMA